jgi:DNA adenine methylase
MWRLDMLQPGENTSLSVTPFLKWAGGKRWLAREYPALFETDFDRYIEPFLGSGAVFFALDPSASLLSDTNAELTGAFGAIREDWKAVRNILANYHKRHCRDLYYETRALTPSDPFEAAARFIYLNRTCWNGLYRVNQKGQFNVPMGTKTNVLLQDNLSCIAKVLQKAEIRTCDFSDAMAEATLGDLVFVDPPYTVHHNVNGFLKYNQKLFTWEDQIRLRDAVVSAVGRGAKVIVSNAAHVSVRVLYKDVGEIVTLDRSSVISGSPLGRRKEQEIVIKCL